MEEILATDTGKKRNHRSWTWLHSQQRKLQIWSKTHMKMLHQMQESCLVLRFIDTNECNKCVLGNQEKWKIPHAEIEVLFSFDKTVWSDNIVAAMCDFRGKHRKRLLLGIFIKNATVLLLGPVVSQSNIFLLSYVWPLLSLEIQKAKSTAAQQRSDWDRDAGHRCLTQQPWLNYFTWMSLSFLSTAVCSGKQAKCKYLFKYCCDPQHLNMGLNNNVMRALESKYRLYAYAVSGKETCSFSIVEPS